MWPFRRRREVRSYTDSLTSLLIRTAEGDTSPKGQAHATAAVEACAGAWARAFACAEVSPEVDGVTPGLLARVARSLIVEGESLHVITVGRGGLALLPAGSFDVLGTSPDPAAWRYRANLYGPDGTTTVTRPAAAVVHVRYSDDPSRPWRGVSPLERAGLDSDLLSALVTRLGQEAGAKSAYVIPTPVDGQSGTVEDLRSDIGNARGGVVMAEGMAGGYGDKGGGTAGDGFKQQRIGAHPPDVLRALRSEVGMAVCGATGVPPSLFEAKSDGTSQREAWRRFAHGSVGPVAKLVAAELAAKLDAPGLAFDFGALYASDLVGRAGAFQRMVAGGMEVDEAAKLSGVLGADG